MSIFVEKYRPKNIDEFICSDSFKQKFKEFITNKDIPNLLLTSSKPGTGKTSIAKILVKSIPCDYLYINASEERGIEVLRNKIMDFAYYIGTEGLKICVLDEADFLSIVPQAALRNLLESTSEHTRFILTCNYINKIIEPLRSRCQIFEFKSFTKEQITERLKYILKNENISYNEKDVEQIAKNSYPDIRKAINVIQKCSTNNKLELRNISFEKSINYKILELLFKKQWKEIRKLLATESVDYNELYEFLFDEIANLDSKILPEEIAGKILLIISDRINKNSFSAVPEINFLGAVLEISELL